MEQNRNKQSDIALSFLKGTWSFTRHMDGHGRMSGTAQFIESEPETLAYTESGIHELPGGQMLNFFQNYIYQREREQLVAYFTDGRPFHEVRFYREDGVLKAGAIHLCGADRYNGTYIFDGTDHFSLIWDVKGPKKDYIIQTRYNRS